MELENFFCKVLDISYEHVRKYPNEAIAQELYYNVYAPIVNHLIPFMRNYDGSENAELADVLCRCRALLSDNFAISNPTHIKRIDEIIQPNKEFIERCSYVKNAQDGDKNSVNSRKMKKDKKLRKRSFEYFVHGTLIEYNILRKTIGIKKLSLSQRIRIDQIEYEDNIPNVIIILFLTVILGIILIFCFFTAVLNAIL